MIAEQVLVVEDNPDIREGLVMLLREDGYCVREAENGRAALDQLLSGSCSPSVILLDMAMPVLDGRGFMAELRRRPVYGSIDVILCSASPNLDQLATELGVSGYLAKPAEYSDIVQMMTRLQARAMTAGGSGFPGAFPAARR